MSFLDNLENNLKSLESAEQAQDEAERRHKNREVDLAQLRAAAPHADALKHSPFTAELLKHASRIGFSMRTKVHFAWLGTTLRLEAKERRLELRPTADGVVAVYLEGAEEVRRAALDFKGSAEELVRRWLTAA